MQIMKQLFDVGHLFAEATNLDHVDTTYRATFETQNQYRGGSFTLEHCLDDTIEAARAVCLIPSSRTAEHTPHQSILRSGQIGLGSHLLAEPFTLDRHARVAASRAALLATLIRYRMVSQVPRNIAQRVPSLAELRQIALSGENAELNPILRPLAPEALYYWSIIEDAIALSRDATP